MYTRFVITLHSVSSLKMKTKIMIIIYELHLGIKK